MPKEDESRTIVGFLYDGWDFGTLWDKLTDEQRAQVKKQVFDMTLNFNGFKSDNYKDNLFEFTDAEREQFESSLP